MLAIRKSIRGIALALGLGVVAPAANAAIYDIDWTGANGYSLVGTLIFDDSLIGTGIITEKNIQELSIGVRRNGRSLGFYSLLAFGLGPFDSAFNVNFDTISERFLTGGRASSLNGQAWFSDPGGLGCGKVGFASGTRAQSLCINGSFVRASSVPLSSGALSVSRVAPIPLPATALLLVGALGGLGLLRRRRATA